MNYPPEVSSASLKNSLDSPPQADLTPLWNLGVAGVPTPQYLRWAEEVGLFNAMADQDLLSDADILARTTLSERGIDALLGVLRSLRLVKRVDGQHTLEAAAREYLDKRSPYYIGHALYGMCKRPLPFGLQKGDKPRKFSKITGTFWYWVRFIKKSAIFWGKPVRLQVQHSRNFPAAVVAAGSTQFEGIAHLVDVGGGSGVFAIPLALRYPQMRISLVELPAVVPNIDMFLKPYSLSGKVRLLGHDIHKTPWPIQDCDAILFANILHFCADDECHNLLQECYRLLPPGGRVILHEMLWNEEKDGPLVTAYWNFWLISVSAGRQRTRSEFADLLSAAGFSAPIVEETRGGFSLVVSRKS